MRASKMLVKWTVVAALIGAAPIVAVGCGNGDSSSTATTSDASVAAPATTGSTTPRSDDGGKAGGTPDEHVDKPGEIK